MAKYSAEFKLNIVKEYLNGHLGFKTLAKKHNIANSNLIMDWVRNYRTMGDEGFQRSRKNKTYSFQFKLDAVKLYLSTEISFRDLALKLHLKNSGTLVTWVQCYRAVGVEGLKPQRKGRRPKVTVKTNNESNNAVWQDERLKQLEEENLKLRIQVAYLKELRRLRLEEEAKKQKQGLFTVSEDHSN